jgi:hypothetical protein
VYFVQVYIYSVKYRRYPYLERQSPVYGGESPFSLVSCLMSTAFMPLALPSPPAPAFPPTGHLFTYRQHEYACSSCQAQVCCSIAYYTICWYLELSCIFQFCPGRRDSSQGGMVAQRSALAHQTGVLQSRFESGISPAHSWLPISWWVATWNCTWLRADLCEGQQRRK